ncbi:MAG: sulfotransferase domain-containing protein [Bacteroidota bacterium]
MAYRLYNTLRLHGRDTVFFALQALNTINRATKDANNPLVICNSFPKSGTHLLGQILDNMPNAKTWHDIVSVQALSGVMNTGNHIQWKIASAPVGAVVRTHLMCYDEIKEILKKRNHKRFFIYRDLRDVAISHANWVVKEPRIFLHGIYNDLPTFDERLMYSIKGTPLGTPFTSNLSNPDIGLDFRRYLGWISDPDTLAVKFEELVGARGGSTDELRFETIRKIVNHLEIEMSDSEIKSRFSNESLNPSTTRTFNKGKMRQWEEKFTPEHKQAFKAVAGDLLIELGYEKDLNW